MVKDQDGKCIWDCLKDSDEESEQEGMGATALENIIGMKEVDVLDPPNVADFIQTLLSSLTREQQRDIGQLFKSLAIMQEHQASATGMVACLSKTLRPGQFMMVLKTAVMQPLHQVIWPEVLIPEQMRTTPPPLTSTESLAKKKKTKSGEE